MFRRALLGLFLLAAAAIPASAQFNGCVAGFCSSSSQWVFPGATLDLDFANNRYFGVANGIDSLTTTRASTGYAQALNGTWVNFGNNIARRTDRGLLVEESRTNSIRNNSMQGAVAGSPGTLPTNWGVPSLAGLTETVVAVGAVNGIDYIDLRYQGTTTGTILFRYFESTLQIAASVGQTFTYSSFLAMVGGSAGNIASIRNSLTERNSVGSVLGILTGQNVLSSLSSNLTRFADTGTTLQATTAAAQPGFAISFASGVAIDVTIRIGWPQLELGAFATSPIRTTAAAATRAADVVTLATGSWFNAGAGTLYGSVKTASVQGIRTLAVINNGADNDRYTIRSSSGSMAGTIITGGVLQAEMLKGTLAASALLKSAMAFEPNNAAFTTAGATPETDITINLPTVTTLRVGSRQNAEYMNGYIERIAYFPRRLSNTELQSLTQ